MSLWISLFNALLIFSVNLHGLLTRDVDQTKSEYIQAANFMVVCCRITIQKSNQHKMEEHLLLLKDLLEP